MKSSLLNKIVCPLDDRNLTVEKLGLNGNEIIEGNLTCGIGHTYPIRKGVPCFLQENVLSPGEEATKNSFSKKWNRIPDFGHESKSYEFYVNWYLQRYGFGNLEGLNRYLKDKHLILDAGTGLGRDTLLYSENSDAEVFGLDICESIYFAYDHVGHREKVHLMQADLNQPPFRKNFFDFIASDQVLHHTKNSELSFKKLVDYLAPGGEIVFYVYKKKGPIREFCDNFLRNYYHQASEEECYAFSRAMTALGKSLSDMKTTVEIPEDIPILGIKAGRQDLQRFIYWNIFKCYWNDELSHEVNVMTNFDWYHPQYAHRHTPEEVLGWCQDLGLKISHFDVVESGISVRAGKR